MGDYCRSDLTPGEATISPPCSVGAWGLVGRVRESALLVRENCVCENSITEPEGHSHGGS